MPTYEVSYERQDGEDGPWTYCSQETVFVEAPDLPGEDLKRTLKALILERHPEVTELRNLRWRW